METFALPDLGEDVTDEDYPNTPPKMSTILAQTPSGMKRPAYRGSISTQFYRRTEKSAYVEDGNQMFKANRDISETEEKLKMLQARINLLQRKDQEASARLAQSVEKLRASQQSVISSQSMVNVSRRPIITLLDKGAPPLAEDAFRR